MVAADLMAVVGFVLIAGGLALVSVPLAMVAAGGILLAGGLWSHYSHAAGPPVPPPAGD